MEQDNRVVVLIDMDCFYCQVEEKLNPELAGKPIAVVQYNPWKGGGIIAVNYVARAMGVTRHMRGDEAKEKCPEIELPSVPCVRGKADITKYRDAGKDVAKVLQQFTPLLERASIDEAYLDITSAVHERLKKLSISSINLDIIPNTYALGYDNVDEFVSDILGYGNGCLEFDYDNSQMLLVGAVIVSEIRAAVYEQTGYRCSAGIAHNKILAKLVCGMNKPNKQTILPKNSINILYKTLSVKKVKHLGGKFGDLVCESLKIINMGELQKFTEKELQSKFDEKNGTWLYNIARGVDTEPVQARFNPKSIGCCKQFRGKSALIDLNSLRKWLKDLGDEIEDRLDKDALENNRTPKQMVVSFSVQLPSGQDNSSSRSYNFTPDEDLSGELFTKKALDLVLESAEGNKYKDEETDRKLKAPIKFLGISVGKFEDNSECKKNKKILDYFTTGSAKMINEMPQEKKNTKRPVDKDIIFKKFFQGAGTTVTDSKEIFNNLNKHKEHDKSSINFSIETNLDKQESFFAKFLKQKINSDSTEHQNSSNLRPSTPQCNSVQHGDTSNDSDYSGSTINMEINKSIALFEDEPTDVNRVSDMRKLLNSSILPIKETSDTESNIAIANVCNKSEEDSTMNREYNENVHPTPVRDDEFQCPECNKMITISGIETHSDFHFAQTLRDDERRQRREERLLKPNLTKVEPESKQAKKTPSDISKSESTSSMANFLVKIDGNVPCETCTECGKKVSVEKFAEHLDFHEAQKLNRELNRKSSSTSYFTGNSVKRKRKSISPVKKPKVPCKSIDSFFR